MDAELWKRVDAMFQIALSLGSDDRAAYLQSAASGDPVLRQEVESLLRHADETFLESSPFGSGLLNSPTAALLKPGDIIRDFEVIGLLGSGGMGEVYRVRDRRLNREVALKVLSSGGDQRRFEREARAVAALKHPNVTPLYEFGNENGIWFLVEELVEGGSLEELLRKGRLPLEQCLRLAIEIAGGLAAAHRAGIVHRDLKPGNVMLTAERTAKIVDFGLSRTVPKTGEAPGALTSTGIITGTAAYMSPEQAEGKSADTRSDIFSYGSVLYEMITGRRAFAADSITATLVAILRDQPAPVTDIVKDVPRDLARILARCFRKDPAQRYQVIEDVKLALEEVLQEPDTSGNLIQHAGPQWRYRWAIALAAFSGMLLAAGGAFLLRPRPMPEASPKITRLTSDAGLTTDPAFSPDGKLLAYASDQGSDRGLDIWVRQVSGGSRVQLTHDGLENREPSFSPDGSTIVFRSGRARGGIYVVPTFGGEPRRIADAGRRPRFSPDGEQVAYWKGPDAFVGPREAQQILIVPSGGGSPRLISSGFAVARSPVWSPDGSRILFLGKESEEAQPHVSDVNVDWWVTPIKGGPPIRLGVATRLSGPAKGYPDPAEWTRDQGIVFTADAGDVRNVWQIPVGADGSHLSGPAHRLTVGSSNQTSVSWAGSRLAFSAENFAIDLWALAAESNAGKVNGDLQRLTRDAGSNFYPSLASDGSRMVFSSDRHGTLEVWFRNFKTATEAPFFGSTGGFVPSLTPDGATAMYSRSERNHASTYLTAIGPDGSFGIPRRVCMDCLNAWTCSPDAKTVLFSTNFEQREIYALEVESGQKKKVIESTKPIIGRPQFSPDGKWIAFQRWRGSEFQIFVVAFDDAAKREDKWIPITDGSFGDRLPYWSPNGQRLYFFSERDGNLCLWAQRLDEASKRPVGPAMAVHHFHSARHSLRSVPLIQLGMSFTKNKIVLSTGDATGNIWMADYRPK